MRTITNLPNRNLPHRKTNQPILPALQAKLRSLLAPEPPNFKHLPMHHLQPKLLPLLKRLPPQPPTNLPAGHLPEIASLRKLPLKLQHLRFSTLRATKLHKLQRALHFTQRILRLPLLDPVLLQLNHEILPSLRHQLQNLQRTSENKLPLLLGEILNE